MLLVEVGYAIAILGDVFPVPLGVPAVFTFTAVRGTPPYVFDYTTDLPGGSALEWELTDNGDGTFTVETDGPVTEGTFSLTLTAVDAERYPATRTVSIRTFDVPQPLTLTGSPDDAEEGTPYTFLLARAGGVGAITITAQSGFPTGVSASVDGSTVEISGTPGAGTSSGSPYSPSVTIEDSLGNTAIWNGTLVVDAASVWTPGGSWTPTSNGPGWEGYTLRSIIPVSAIVAGSKIRLHLTAGSGGNAVVVDCFVYFRNALTAGFTAAPTRVQVLGSNGFTVTAGNTVVTDEIALPVDGTQELLVSAYFNAVGASHVGHLIPNPNWASYYKLGNDASTVSGAGFTAQTGDSYFATSLDILVP